MAKRDYYEVLGVAKDADGDAIKKAYRKLALQHHPDRNAGDSAAEEKFKEATEAFDVLSNEDKRARYDRYGHAGLNGSVGGVDPRTLFDNLFGGGGLGDILEQFFGGGGHSAQRGGGDVQTAVDIDLTEAAAGCRKSLSIERLEWCAECDGSGSKRGTKPGTCRRCHGHGEVIFRQGIFQARQRCPGCGGRGLIIADPCSECRGNGRVRQRRTIELTVPPGVENGTPLLYQGGGHAGAPGEPRGDLVCIVRVRDHPLLHREGQHLICQVPITVSQAALGGEIEVPTLTGPQKIKLARGVQSGEPVRVPGLGMPNPRGGRKGDLIIQVIVETPKHLTKRQEELFRELAELDQKHVSPQRKSFLDKLRAFFGTDA